MMLLCDVLAASLMAAAGFKSMRAVILGKVFGLLLYYLC